MANNNSKVATPAERKLKAQNKKLRKEERSLLSRLTFLGEEYGAMRALRDAAERELEDTQLRLEYLHDENVRLHYQLEKPVDGAWKLVEAFDDDPNVYTDDRVR